MNRRRVRQRTANVETAAAAEEMDRLSSLPDSLLVDILNRVARNNEYDIQNRMVGMKEAAKTAVLSKQWRFLWMNLPLEFHLPLEFRKRDPDKIDQFVAMVHAALAVRRGPALRSLDVSFKYYGRHASDVDSWLHFAAINKVETLKLHLCNADRNMYTLPRSMYSNSSLTELCLGGCIVIPPTTVDWPCLKKLSLGYIKPGKLGKGAIDLILPGCPVLETLELNECGGIERLHIGGGRPRRLMVVCCNDGCGLRRISAPYVRELELELWCDWMKRGRTSLRIKNVPYLEKATVNMYVFESIREEVMRRVIKLFEDIRHVKTLRLSEDCIKVISIMASNGKKLPQLEVEDLTIEDLPKDVRTVSGVVAILESCPYLKKLALHTVYVITKEESLNWGPITRDYLNCDLLDLKIVEFNVYCSEFSGELVSAYARMLQRASALEEIVINVETPFMSTEEIDSIKEKFFNYPKSGSTKASVVVRK